MRVALIGYGKMGREIEAVLKEQGDEIVLVVDKDSADKLSEENLKRAKVDVAIEFSTPQTAFGNIALCLKAGVPVVSGTTGWLDRFEDAERVCLQYNGALFYASNYSVGVNVMYAINERLAQLMNHFNRYDVTVEEVHHTEKRDCPSGTAITIAEGIVARVERKKRWVNSTTTAADELEVMSIRRSVVTGTHVVTYESQEDQIRLTHTAKSRQGFAQGAILAARFLLDKKGVGVFGMQDLLKF